MTRKTEECYKHLFRYIDSNIVKLCLQSFMTDYEVAMRNALAEVYPTAQLFACWLHFCQAVKKHASQIVGLVPTVRESNETAKIYYCSMCLPLLPPELIEEAYTQIKLEAQMKFGDKLDKFFDYFHRQWMLRVRMFYT